MIDQGPHISDRDLLQAADGELSRRRSAVVRAHCENCWSCRARMAGIESTIIDFARAYRQTLDVQLPHIAGPRALLKARLAERAQLHEPSTPSWLPRRALALLAAIACLSLFAATIGGTLLRNSFHAKPAERGSVPDHFLTPGMTRPVSISEVCSMPHEEVIRDVSNSLRQQVFEEYGIKTVNADDYEIDYLIAPGLGGSDDIHNLWPQPYKSYEWNARVKDALEERLHELVCAHQIDLKTAQKEIATDWIAAYMKYFHTSKPQFRGSLSG
jgi:hypothetical protein